MRRETDYDQAQHAGLLLTRSFDTSLLATSSEGGSEASDAAAKAKTLHVDRIVAACARAQPLYKNAFAQRSAMLRSFGNDALLLELDAVGALAVGVGYPVALGQGASLHHLYGTPLIPGSSIKGALRAYTESLPAAAFRPPFAEVENAASLDDDDCKAIVLDILFGTTESGGFVDVLDAWIDPQHLVTHKPGEVAKAPFAALQPDVITPHHQGYMLGKNEPPADWDMPIPVPYVTSTGTFHFALIWRGMHTAFDDAVIALVSRWLEDTLCGGGEAVPTAIGAKTAAGYGYFKRSEER